MAQQNHQIKMSLMFDVNSSKAKASLQDLQKSINGLTKNIGKGELGLTTDIQEAYVAAEKLKRVLNDSVNMNTGQFDLSKFQYQLKQSGMSVQSLSTDFMKAGAQGVQAFNSLTSAIINAEIPTKRMHQTLDRMVQSFKDTMRWQISSSMVHGLTGALQSAYGYAKDLNASLNDIRIVTGYNTEYMARFAKEANNAAKALGTSTNEYAKASLIFYQQGTLTDEQVAQRTAATIKMANVTGEAAKDISSYMTAIWNNFDDGSKAVEYYADVITALGAATASSSEEIATGMQQFAAIGKTVGLSYEYAASALATVVAETRQSEETVGTSFKTIFSRLQSLSLGETLDDDTTLTKYSAALAKVGIDIKMGNGELKSMDTILDELGAKWAQLNSEQKNALAYTVAGSRQYTNFIALLDNYDTFKVNIEIAEESEGTLEEQQKIYAESWEAAAQRVRAAAEGIFQDLIDDKFFITLLNGAEKLLSMLDLFMDSIGGLPGVLSLVSSLMLKIFSSQVTTQVRDIGYGLSHFLGIAQAKAGKTKKEFAEEAQKISKRARVDTVGDPMLNAELDSMSYRIKLEQEYIALESTLTDKQREQYQIQLSMLDIMREQKKERMAAIAEAEKELQKMGPSIIKGAHQVSEEDFNPAKKQAWSLQRMGDLQEASARVASTRGTAELKQDELNSRLGDSELAHEELESAQSALAAIQAKHAAAVQAKGAGFGNTTKGQSQAEAEADKELGRQLTEATKLVETLQARVKKADELLATATAQARQAQEVHYEALFDQSEVVNATQPEFKPIDTSQVGTMLRKYMSYSSGRNEMLEKTITDTLEGLKGISREELGDEEYEKALADLATSLKDFQEDYSIELGEKTNTIIDEIITALETTWNGEGVDVSQADIEPFKKRLLDAAAADRSTYRTGTSDKDGRIIRQGTAEDIKNAMQQEQGIILTEEGFAEFEQGYKNYAKQIREFRRLTEKEVDGVKKAFDGLNKPPEKLFDFADRITGLAQGFSNLTLAISSVKGAWDAISNPDLSGWERFMAVFTALSTVIGSVMSIMQLVSKFKAGENEKTAKETLITWLNTIAQKENAKARKQSGDAAQQQGKEIDQVTKEKQEEIATDAIDAVKDKVTEGGKEAGSKVGKEVLEEGGEQVAGGMAKGGQSLGQAFAKALPKLGPIIGGVALIAAGVLAIATAITLTVKGYNKARDAAKKAAETAQHFSEVSTEAQSKYNDVVSTISSYKEALAGMEDLTKGTAKWDEALLKTNEHAFDLINQFDELAGKYHFEDGKVVFDEKALEEVEQLQMAKAKDAQATAYAASIAAKKAKGKADVVDLARKMESDEDWGMKWANLGAAAGTGLVGGAAIGAGIGTIAGSAAYGVGALPGWALGALIGGGAGALTGAISGAIAMGFDNISSENEENIMEELVDLYGKNASAFENDAEFKKLLEQTSIDLNDTVLIDSLMRNREELAKNVAALHANNEAIKAQTQAMIDAANQDNENYTSSEYKDYLAVFGQQAADKEGDNSKRAEIEAEVKELWKGKNEDFWDEYLETMYGDEADQYRIKNIGGNNVTLQKQNADGTWETQGEKDSLNEEAAEAALIEKKLAQLDDREIVDFEKKAKRIEGNLTDAGLREDMIRNVGLTYADGRSIDLSALTGAQLDNIDFKAITDTTLREAMKQAAANAEESWQKILDKYSSHVVDELDKFDSAIADKGYAVTREQLDLYAAALQDFTQTAGPQAATVFNENLVKVMEENSDKAADIMNLVAEIDWSNPQIGLNKFNKGMTALGISVNAYGWEVDNISSTLGEMALNNGLITDTEYLVALFEQLNGLTGKLSLGGLLDGYAKDALIEAGLADSGDFLETYDGQFRYVGTDYKYTDRLAYDAAVAQAEAAADTAAKNEIYSDFKSRAAVVKTNDANSLSSMLNTMTDEEYRLFVKKSLGTQAPATLAEAKAAVANGGKLQDTVKGWEGYKEEFGENYWREQKRQAAEKIAADYIYGSMDNLQWQEDYFDAQQYTLAKEYYSDDQFEDWFKEQQKLAGRGALPFAQDSSFGGESDADYRKRIEDYYSKVLSIQDDSDDAIKNLTADLMAASENGGVWNGLSGFGGDMAHYYDDYFTNENGQVKDGDLATLLETYLDAEEVIEAEREVNKDQSDDYKKAVSDLNASNALFSDMYTIFTNAASDPNSIKGYKSEAQRVQDFKLLIGGANSLSDLTALKENESFAELFNNAEVQETYNTAYKALARINHQEQKLLDSLEDEKAQRDKINTKLEHTRDLYDKIASGDQIANLDKQRIYTRALVKKDQEILNGTKRKQSQDRFNLQKTIGKDVATVKVDKDGNILNYEELRSAALQQYGSNSQQYQDIIQQLENYKASEQEVLDLTESLAENTEWLQTYWATVGEGIGAYIDGINSSIGSSTNLINHYKNVIDLVGEEVLGITSENLNDLREVSQLSANASLEAQKAQYDLLKEARANAEKELAYASEEEYAIRQKAIEDLQKQEQAALDAMNESFSTALQQAAQNFTDQISQVTKEFEQSLSGSYKSFADMATAYSQASQLDSHYLDDYKKLYELNKLSRNLDKTLNSTNSLKGKQELQELQEKIIRLQAEGSEVSEHDLEVAQKEYDLAVAKIALEEAQNAKSQVRLQKMANGSWGYVYTQNETDIAAAQQSYEDKIFALRETNEKYLDNLGQQVISIESELTAKLNEIGAMTNISEEERSERMKEAIELAKQNMLYVTKEIDKTLGYNRDILNTASEFSDTLLGSLMPDVESAQEIYQNFIDSIGNEDEGLLGDMLSASANYTEELNNIFEITESSFSSFTENLTDNVNAVTEALENGIATMGDYVQAQATSWNANRIAGTDRNGNEITRGELQTTIKDWYSMYNPQLETESAEDYEKRINADLLKMSDSDLAYWWNQMVGLTQMDGTNYTYIDRFATGGYTGEWGPEGRLAVVDEKELILNAQDTQNLLQTMQVMDQMLRNIELQAAAAAFDHALSANLPKSGGGDTLQQEVTIHAEFPNATNHSEIEQAFDTLINRASQFANRNR